MHTRGHRPCARDPVEALTGCRRDTSVLVGRAAAAPDGEERALSEVGGHEADDGDRENPVAVADGHDGVPHRSSHFVVDDKIRRVKHSC